MKPIKNRDLLAAVVILAFAGAAASLVSLAREDARARQTRRLAADIEQLATRLGEFEADRPALARELESAEQLRIIAEHIARQDAEQARRLAADLAALAESQAVLRARLDHLTDGLAALDARCRKTEGGFAPPAPEAAPHSSDTAPMSPPPPMPGAAPGDEVRRR